MTETCEELLFFDTFSHQNAEHPELNLDLVHFPTPVCISEVRIVPLGARIQADFPGGVRLGATNPSQFNIEFFINDLTKSTLSTFECFGSLDYDQNGSISLLRADSKHVPTDGLILKGCYSTITLAVYGILTKIISEPVEEAQASLKTETNTNQEPEVEKELTIKEEPLKLEEDVVLVEKNHEPEPEVEQVSQEKKPDEAFELIVSDEEICDDVLDLKNTEVTTVPEPESEQDNFDYDLLTEDDLKIYDPFTYEFPQVCKSELTVVDFDTFLKQLKALCETQITTNEKQVLKIEQLNKLIQSYRNEFAKFLQIKSEITFFLNTFQFLMQFGLNFQLAMNQAQLSFKIRHLKSTFRFFETCLEISLDDFIERIPENFLIYVYNQFFSLLNQELMAPPLKLQILRLIDAFLYSASGIQIFIQIDGYKKLLNFLSNQDQKKTNLFGPKFSAKSILNKIHLFELLFNLEEFINKDDATDKLTMAMEQIEIDYLNEMSLKYAQPSRFLPIRTQFQINNLQKIRMDFHQLFIRYFKITRFLPNILLSLTIEQPDCKIVSSVISIVTCLLKTKLGFEYLLQDHNSLNLLLKLFLDQPNQMFGLKVSYMLQSYYQLVYESKSNNCTDVFNFLFCLTYSPIGKTCLAQVLSLMFNELYEKLIENQNCLINVAYLIDLLHLVFIYGDNMNFVENQTNFRKIHEVLLKFDKVDSDIINKTTLKDLLEITTILIDENDDKLLSILCEDDVSKLIEVLQKNLSVTNLYKIKPLLIFLLRLTYYRINLSDSDLTTLLSNGNYQQLKHKYAILQIYSLDLLSSLLNFLEKVYTTYNHIQIHNNIINTTNFQILLLSLDLILKIIKTIFEHLIDARKEHFKDLTSLQILLKIYSILASIKPQSHFSKECQNTLIEIFLSFTQPFLIEVTDTDLVMKSIWTQMIGQILKFAISLPNRFVPTLKLLTELLPLPLPIPIREKDSLTATELQSLLNFRTLWSGHLLYHHNELYDLINCLCRSRDRKLLRLLEKFCGQISDLTANSALMIAKILLNIISSSSNNNDLIILNFIACVFQQSSIKVSVLDLLSKDDKFKNVFREILVASNTSADKVDCVLNMIQTLCDSEIGLVNNVYDSMPSKDTLQKFIRILINVLEEYSHNIIIVTSVLRIFLLLTEQDYGFFHLKEQLLRESMQGGLISQLLQGIPPKTVTKDFLVVLMQLQNNFINVTGPNRTLKITLTDMQYLLNWSNDQKAYLTSLFENFPELIDLLNGIIKLLEEDSIVKEEVVISEITTSVSQPLMAQFENRQLVTVIDNSDEISYWIDTTNDEEDHEDDNSDAANRDNLDKKHLIEVNLLDIYQKNVTTTGISLKQLVENLYKSKDEKENKNETNPKMENNQKNRTTVLTSGKQQIFSRAAVMLPQRNDLFRSRPPNTSRPPSLHVDDFVALETCGAQPTGPTGYNKISRDIFNSRIIARTRNLISTESSYFFYNRGLGLHTGAQFREAYYVTNPYSYIRPGLMRNSSMTSSTAINSALRYSFLRNRD